LLNTSILRVGEGSDEHFAGYPSFRADALCEPDYSWPASDFSRAEREKALVKVRGEAGSGEFGERSINIPASAKRVHQNVDVAGATERVGSLPFANWTDCFGVGQLEERLLDGLSGTVRDAITNKWHPLHAGLYLNTKFFLPHFILRYNGDNVDMVSQVESRCPFLDHHLTGYVNGLPPSLKLKYDPSEKLFREKHVLREAAKPFITEEIYNRTKKPFLGPQKFLPGGPLHRTITRLVTKENVEGLGFADWGLAKEALEKAFHGFEPLAFRRALTIAQFIVLGQRFGVRTAASHPN
jgi:asparagine synthase (glutamine-hydrolysing)